MVFLNQYRSFKWFPKNVVFLEYQKLMLRGSSFLRKMVKNAMAWAKSKGLERISPIHGAEEYKIPTDCSFSHEDVERSKQTVSAETSLEAWPPHT